MSSHDVSVFDRYTWDSALFLLAFSLHKYPIAGDAVRFLRWRLQWDSRNRLDPTRFVDVYLLLVLSAWWQRQYVIAFLSRSIVFRIILATIVTAVLLYLGSVFSTWRNRAVQNSWTRAILKQDALSTPWIIPSRTKHTRIFPKQHSFAYSYLAVAVPVGFKGWCWPMLSVDVSYAWGWFHVQASDHLERGHAHLDLKEKLSHYLQSQGVQDSDWTYAYLLTAPRFLGYSFNPVSFWYIYDARRRLKKMILEVNNTFDERRMYLLDGEDEPCDGSSAKFKQTWPKDFHVSPFNSRKGSYSLTASDPFSCEGCKLSPVDNTIVMSSSKHHAKLIASLKSEGDALNPRDMTRLQMLRFLARWWWVGFFTFPRIVKEAGILFFKRKLHVWFRPEVLDTSIGRHASPVEKLLQPFADDYISSSIRDSPLSLVVLYERPDGTSIEICSDQSTLTKDGADQRHLKIRILTPAFYSRFIHYARVREAFDRESLFTDEKNRTIWISDPVLLAEVFSRNEKGSTPSSLSWGKRLRWSLHMSLRCPAAAQAYPNSSTNHAYNVTDIRPSVLSGLDRFVLEQGKDSWLYLRCCGRVFLAERFAFGVVPIIDLLDFLLRALLCYWVTVPAILSPARLPRSSEIFDYSLLQVIGDVLGLWALHLWSQTKGL